MWSLDKRHPVGISPIILVVSNVFHNISSAVAVSTRFREQRVARYKSDTDLEIRSVL